MHTLLCFAIPNRKSTYHKSDNSVSLRLTSSPLHTCCQTGGERGRFPEGDVEANEEQPCMCANSMGQERAWCMGWGTVELDALPSGLNLGDLFQFQSVSNETYFYLTHPTANQALPLAAQKVFPTSNCFCLCLPLNAFAGKHSTAQIWCFWGHVTSRCGCQEPRCCRRPMAEQVDGPRRTVGMKHKWHSHQSSPHMSSQPVSFLLQTG